jgi:myo-inositol-1-phosphate synthase
MSSRQIGVWFLGGCGSVATTAMVGARALAAGLAPPTGLVTELEEFRGLDLVEFGDLVFGGHEARPTTPLETARQIAAVGGSIPSSLLETLGPDLEDLAAEIRPARIVDTSPAVLERTGAPPRPLPAREIVAQIVDDLADFSRRHDLERVVVVNLTSVEAPRPDLASIAGTPESLERHLDRSTSSDLSPGLVYAYAALSAGCGFVNFTTAPGPELPALDAMARDRGLPHCGRDGKTGETLLKTTLAPMFLARHLRVLSWEGHNLLGGGDGQVLSGDENLRAKTASKDRALSRIFEAEPVHTGVRIDYVPSLGDWKTAWEFIHFEGFLGVRMILQVLWQGCDSALAAPLVLDLVRLTDLARRRGERGAMKHTACFFKDPIGIDEHEFPAQWEILRRYVADEVRV